MVRRPTIALISVGGAVGDDAARAPAARRGRRRRRPPRGSAWRTAPSCRARRTPHRRPERVARLDVERDRRLVEHEQVGVADEREREAHPLRLAARELLRAPLGERLDAGELEHLVDGSGVGVERGHHRARARARRGRGSGRPSAASRRRRPRRPPRGRAAEQRDAAGVRAEQAEQHVDSGRLARAVRPEQRDGLAGRDARGRPRGRRARGPVGLANDFTSPSSRTPAAPPSSCLRSSSSACLHPGRTPVAPARRRRHGSSVTDVMTCPSPSRQ